MSVKFGNEAIEDFDVAKTLGQLSLMEINPIFEWEDVVNEDTGEMVRRPTDEIIEYDVLVYSSADDGRLTVTIPVEAKGIEIDVEKNYRKPLAFQGLTARLWNNRESFVNAQGRRVTTYNYGVKFRATDFSLAGANNQPKQNQNQGDQK